MKLTHSQISEILSNYTSSSEGHSLTPKRFPLTPYSSPLLPVFFLKDIGHFCFKNGIFLLTLSAQHQRKHTYGKD